MYPLGYTVVVTVTASEHGVLALMSETVDVLNVVPVEEDGLVDVVDVVVVVLVVAVVVDVVVVAVVEVVV